MTPTGTGITTVPPGTALAYATRHRDYHRQLGWQPSRIKQAGLRAWFFSRGLCIVYRERPTT